MTPMPPQFRRWCLLFFAFLSISLSAGLVYGWPALRDDLNNDHQSTLSEKDLGAMFTAASWSALMGSVLGGVSRDRCGTRAVASLGFVLGAGGLSGIAWSDNDNHGWLIGLSLVLVALGGSCVQQAVLPVASLFPIHAGMVLSLFTGAYQISGLVFLVLTTISDSRKPSFLGLAVWLLGMGVVAALFLPKGASYHSVEVEEGSLAQPDSDEAALSHPVVEGEPQGPVDTGCGNETGILDNLSSEDSDMGEKSLDETANSDEKTKPPSAVDQMRNLEYIGLVAWFALATVVLQYYIGSIGFQLEARGDESGFFTDLFAIIFASSAVVSPVAGYVVDKFGHGIAQGLTSVTTAATMFVLSSKKIPLEGHAVGLALYSISRMMTFSCFFSNVGKRFGFTFYGTLSGVGMLTSAIVSLLQYPLIALASEGHDSVIDIVCGAMLLAKLPYCFWLWLREKKG